MRTYSLSPSKTVQYTVTNLATNTCYIHVCLCASSDQLLLCKQQAAHPTMSIGWHTLTYWWLQLAFPSLQHVKWLRNKARMSEIHPQEKDTLIAECLNMRLIVENFQGRKLSQISRFCGYMQNFSTQNLVAWHPLVRQKWAIHESFLSENRIVHQFAKVFSLESFPLYGNHDM